jgi:hypothetical protein
MLSVLLDSSDGRYFCAARRSSIAMVRVGIRLYRAFPMPQLLVLYKLQNGG